MAAGSRRWNTICARVRLERRPCWLCHQPINYQLHKPHPWSFTGDHRLPTKHGGLDTYANCEAAHWHCNSSRGADDDAVKVTTRRW